MYVYVFMCCMHACVFQEDFSQQFSSRLCMCVEYRRVHPWIRVRKAAKAWIKKTRRLASVKRTMNTHVVCIHAREYISFAHKQTHTNTSLLIFITTWSFLDDVIALCDLNSFDFDMKDSLSSFQNLRETPSKVNGFAVALSSKKSCGSSPVGDCARLHPSADSGRILAQCRWISSFDSSFERWLAAEDGRVGRCSVFFWSNDSITALRRLFSLSSISAAPWGLAEDGRMPQGARFVLSLFVNMTDSCTMTFLGINSAP